MPTPTLTETETYETAIRQLTRDDVVDADLAAAGDGLGPDNAQAKQLANRTKWLKARTQADDSGINITATPYVLSATEYANGIIRIVSSIAGASLQFPEPVAGAGRQRTIMNTSANDVIVTTPLGTSTQTLKAGASIQFAFVNTAVGVTAVIPLQAQDTINLGMAIALIGGLAGR